MAPPISRLSSTRLPAAPSTGYLTQQQAKQKHNPIISRQASQRHPKIHHLTWPCPSEGKNALPPTRTQAQVPSNMKPTQDTGPTSPMRRKARGTMTLYPKESRPQTQYFTQNEKTEKYSADEGTKPNKQRGNRQTT